LRQVKKIFLSFTSAEMSKRMDRTKRQRVLHYKRKRKDKADSPTAVRRERPKENTQKN